MARIDPTACELATNILQEHMGDVPAAVFRVLASRGQQRMVEAVQCCGSAAQQPLSAKQVKDALLVLLQQNCAECFLADDVSSTAPQQFVYGADVDAALLRLRFPKFLKHTFDEVSVVGEHIVQALLQNGRLQFQQVRELARAACERDGSEVSDGDISNAFLQLVKEHYVEQAPPCTLPLLDAAAVQPSEGRRRLVRKTAMSEEIDAAKSAATAQHLNYQKTRFSLPDEITDAVLDAVGEPSAAANEEAAAAAADGDGDVGMTPVEADKDLLAQLVGLKRKHEGDSSGRDKPKAKRAALKAGVTTQKSTTNGGDDDADVVLWRVNYDEFNRRFRHHAMVVFVEEKHGYVAGLVVQAILASCRQYETAVDEDSTVAVNIHDIEASVHRIQMANGDGDDEDDDGNEDDDGEDARHVSREQIEEALQRLINDSLGLLSATSDNPAGAAYVLNMLPIIHYIRYQHLCSIIKARFGAPAQRIWRLLLEKKMLEFKQIADLTMIPMKECREHLYAMFRAGFVIMQDIPRTNDHSAQRTYFTWKVSIDAACQLMRTELYRAALRIRCRLQHECEQEQELLRLVELRVTAGQTALNLTANQRTRAERLHKVTGVLELKLLQLDEQIALFKHY